MTDYLTLKNTLGKKVSLNRTYKSSPDYTPVANAKFGINQTLPLISDTALDYPIPILDGTVCDPGDNNFTGSSGGDNSTDNTTTYKEGAGLSDVTAQNLIKNNTNATAIWTISALDTNADDTQHVGLWLYIKDATALAKFVSSGTAFEVKLGSDSSNYYSKTYEAADLSTGWNWITSNTDTLGDWTETGTVSGNIDTFILEITTNNATDTFVAGDVVYDLLRQWEDSDLIRAYESLTLDETNMEATTEYKINAGEASGFLINGASQENSDSPALTTDLSKHEANSKSDTDIFIYTWVDRYI